MGVCGCCWEGIRGKVREADAGGQVHRRVNHLVR